jgi:hypothetical protein
VFIKEAGDKATDLPHRSILGERNFVTEAGFAALGRFEAAHRAATDKYDRQAAAAGPREVRYWRAFRLSLRRFDSSLRHLARFDGLLFAAEDSAMFRRRLATEPLPWRRTLNQDHIGGLTMDWNRVEGSRKQVKGKVKGAMGKAYERRPHGHQR